MASTSDSIIRDPDVLKLREFIAEDPLQGWDKAWKENTTPWDAGEVQPPLRHLIESHELDLPRQGRALIPGCGRGYDAIFIASALGLHALAVDISPLAVQAADSLLASSTAPPGQVSFEVADFFTFNVTDEERFDLIYDYTFFVAIQPSRRPEWGHQMSALIKPGGYLITLIWPLDLPLEGGPPFHVEPTDYVKPLGQGWEKVLDKIPEVSLSEDHKGRERLVVWRRI